MVRQNPSGGEIEQLLLLPPRLSAWHVGRSSSAALASAAACSGLGVAVGTEQAEVLLTVVAFIAVEVLDLEREWLALPGWRRGAARAAVGDSDRKERPPQLCPSWRSPASGRDA
jgi:hypothetical protein